MSSHFPIFVDVQAAPPLVIGDYDVLASKIRLLLKVAPLVDVITASHIIDFQAHPGRVNILDTVTPHDDAVLSMLAGRSMVIIETGDPVRNRVLAIHARSLGVPVNVPDTISLCSFFLGSIVDRTPVIVAISTSGMAPILAQHIRARIEDMLAPATGTLAHYLFRLRDRLKHFPNAVRRGLQHQVLNGPIARYVLAGKQAAADDAIMHLFNSTPSHAGVPSISIVDAGAGASGLLSLDAADAIRNADIVFYDPLVSDEVLDLARREATFTFCQNRYCKNGMSMVSLIAQLDKASKAAARVIYLVGGDPHQISSADFILKALGDHGIACQHIPSASLPRLTPCTAARLSTRTSGAVVALDTRNSNHDENLREGA